VSRPDDNQLFWAALRRAPHNGASSAPVAKLRAYLHEQLVLKSVPSPDAMDVAGRLLDEIEAHEFVTVGDYLGGGPRQIPWNVLEVLDDEGTLWRRAFGAERFLTEDDDTVSLDEYDWITEGGACTDEGLKFYAPLQVMRVARRPK
jgi:hypothetical protein